MEERFNQTNFVRKKIRYPAYQTTSRFHNLYGDIRTWVRELIQNADDAGANEISFFITPKEIKIINNGHPFDSDDIERLLTPSKGGKAMDLTGALNLGALSVLTITDQPFYHSGNTLLKFEMDHEGEDFVPYIDENYPDHFNGTEITLPLHDRLSVDDLNKLEKIDDYLTKNSHLLFTKNLNLINVKYENKTLSLSKNEIKEAISDNDQLRVVELIQKSPKTNEIPLKKEIWLIGKKLIDMPKKFFKKKEFEKHSGNINFPFFVGFHIQNENGYPTRVDYPIYITFPSETPLGFGFALSSIFRPDTSRRGFATDGIDGQLNRYLLRKGSELLLDVIEYFKRQVSKRSGIEKRKMYEALLETLYYVETRSSLESYIKNYIYQPILEYLQENILDHEGNWKRSADVIMADGEMWSFLHFKTSYIDLPEAESVKNLLLDAGVDQYTTRALINDIENGKIEDIDLLINAWSFLINSTEDLSPRMVSNYLLNLTANNALKYETNHLISLLDKIYFYLGNSDNFSKLSMEIKNQLKESSIIFVPEQNTFHTASEVVYHSKDAKKIYADNRYYIRHKDYPNSLSFFRNIGIKTSIKTNQIADYLVEYIGNSDIQMDYLFMLYKILGERFQFISNDRLELLRQSKIILSEDFKSFEKPSNIFIADDKMLLDKFINVKTTIIDKRVLEFFEKIGVKKLSKVITKKVLFNGVVHTTSFSSSIRKLIRDIIPYLENVAQDINLNLVNQWKSLLYRIKCVSCDDIFHELRLGKKIVKIRGASVDYDSIKKLIGIRKNVNQTNPNKCYLDLSKTIASLIYSPESTNKKLLAPLIEKLLRSNNPLETLQDLGFSTILLEAKGIAMPDRSLKIRTITEYEDLYDLELGNVYDYYQINEKVKNILRDQKQMIYKILTFPERTSIGKAERRPAIPKLNLVKNKHLNYYIQDNLNIKEDVKSLKQFQDVLKFIVECMEGNPETVSIAIFNAAINAFNFNGQMIFNYRMLMDHKMDEELPIYLIWIMVAAHELSHNISQGHDKLHSKYMMIFSIRALKDLEKIKRYYSKTFQKQ